MRMIFTPGVFNRKMMRDIITYHTRDTEEPAERIEQTRDILNLIAESAHKKNGY